MYLTQLYQDKTRLSLFYKVFSEGDRGQPEKIPLSCEGECDVLGEVSPRPSKRPK